MATSQVLKVVLSNEYGEERSISLKNSKSSDALSLSTVREAFKPSLDSDVFVSRTGEVLTAVKSASVIVTETDELS